MCSDSYFLVRAGNFEVVGVGMGGGWVLIFLISIFGEPSVHREHVFGAASYVSYDSVCTNHFLF